MAHQSIKIASWRNILLLPRLCIVMRGDDIMAALPTDGVALLYYFGASCWYVFRSRCSHIGGIVVTIDFRWKYNIWRSLAIIH